MPNLLRQGRRTRLPWPVAAVVGTVGFAVAFVVVAGAVEGGALASTAGRALTDPLGLSVALAAFFAAFALRAGAWRAMVPSLPFGQALAAIHVAVGANHVLPLRLGEGLRVVSVVRRARLPLATATASTLTLRTADMLTCAAMALVGGPHLVASVLGPWGGLAVAAVGVAGAGGVVWTARLRKSDESALRLPGWRVLGASTAAWLLEAVLVLVCARWAGLDASYLDAVVIVGASVAAQVAAIAPGGFGTYEAAAVAAWTALGFDPGTALVAALTTHALKTAYSLVAGTWFSVWPAPGLAGRLRLASPRRSDSSSGTETGALLLSERGVERVGPVVLFLPARNEAPRVGDVVRRVPASVCGRPVECVVVDDGSTDGTGDVARAAGADAVVRVDPGRGLGAAVRTGLHVAIERDAIAVAFCDADGEYAPGDLAALVGPILAGEADYVIGSRFAGRIERMLPHRRFGNVVLTRLLSFVARRRDITDGQSGYRALSRDAAAAAEVVHDFNYAQVLTLDLLDKGFRYAEVPITYRFRESGTSFVRLGAYLRAVVPAVYRELNGGQSSTTWVANDARAAAQSTSPVSVPTAAAASASA
jgi:uncharacterized membrane protein YbhN (UPF0104 family)